MSNIDQAALATANWWADRVFGGSVADNGDPDNTAFLLSILSGAQGRPADLSKRDEFVAKLAQHVKSNLERDSKYSDSYTLSTDYGPEGYLATLARDMQLGGSFPWKTMTWTRHDHFVTSMGYGAGGTLAWTADDYVRPACGQGQWDLSQPRGGRLPFKCSAPKYHDQNEHVYDIPDPLCQAPDPYGEDKLCLEPANDYHHTSTDDYMSRWVHEFQA